VGVVIGGTTRGARVEIYSFYLTSFELFCRTFRVS
jgi:hypothetical protein